MFTFLFHNIFCNSMPLAFTVTNEMWAILVIFGLIVPIMFLSAEAIAVARNRKNHK